MPRVWRSGWVRDRVSQVATKTAIPSPPPPNNKPAPTLADAEQRRHGVLGGAAVPLLVAAGELEQLEEPREEVQGPQGLVERLGRVLAGLLFRGSLGVECV